MRVSGCVRYVYSVKGDDVAYCSADDKGLMALVADGASITEVEDSDKYVVNSGIFASRAAARQLIEFYRCLRDDDCGAGIHPEQLLRYYLNATVGLDYDFMRIVRKFLERLARLVKPEAGIASSSTLAAGIAASRGLILTSIGDSSLVMALCPSIGEEDLRSKIGAIHVVSRVKYSSIAVPGAPKFVAYDALIRRQEAGGGKPLFEAKVTAGSIPFLYMGPSTLEAYSQLFNGIVVLAWTDGARLGAPLVSLRMENNLTVNYKTLNFIVGYVSNNATQTLNEILSLLEGRLDVLVDMKVYHVLLLMGCLALNGLASRDDIYEVVKAILEDGSSADLVEVSDDRSIAMAYGWPWIGAGRDSG